MDCPSWKIILLGGGRRCQTLVSSRSGKLLKKAIDFAVDQILGKVPIFEGMLENNSLEEGGAGDVAVKLLLAQDLGSYSKHAIDFAVDQHLARFLFSKGWSSFYRTEDLGRDGKFLRILTLAIEIFIIHTFRNKCALYSALNTNDGKGIHDKHSIKQWREKKMDCPSWKIILLGVGGGVAVKLLLAQDLGKLLENAIDFALDQILGKVPIFGEMVQFSQK
ncbi:hypothetical protein CEXT_228761 [Caerostris extrusa]|uniref:Uncharacterized protein n=1 Tax=Caerostris extrusa TaxID=172846 RepID=A0AAV4Q7E8_CAEEX|nr:hypothetical protein CEXT_228761 [Caerostris extrusa]